VAKEKSEPKGQYGDVVTRLQQIVSSLEGGELSLEESIERFREGMTLVKQGESILADADKTIEQLLSEDGKTAPLKLGDAPAAEPARPAAATRKPTPVAAPPDDDVPF
jgi:exodeoxyribonuclease VII small subunit